MPDVAQRLSFYSKARSLQEVAGLLTTARVLPSVVFTVADWATDRDAIVVRIQMALGSQGPWIVRSSSLSEDGDRFSNAGRFLSVPDVEDISGLLTAVERVVDSYGEHRHQADELLVQPMARGLVASGVATTRDAQSGLEYRVINVTYDSRSDAVTSGASCAASIYLSPHRPPANHHCHAVFDLLEELSALTAGLPLDVEFGIDAAGVILFQVRRLAGAANANAVEARLMPHIHQAIESAGQLLEGDGSSHAVLGVMPDWNPAEMIGLKPRPLSFDLYARLITDRAWALGRVPFGYRDLSHRKLMYRIAGTPYIDIAASIRSLLPADLPLELSEEIVRAALQRLRAEPHLHDKMELTALPTCLTPTMLFGGDESSCLASLDSAAKRQAIEALWRVTREVVRTDGPFSEAMRVIQRHLPLVESKNAQRVQGHEATAHMEVAREVLAQRFSLVARAAFVATAILRGLQEVGAVRPGFFDAFVRGTRTVSHDISQDAALLDPASFVKRYGHVRPGTYDIRTPTYADTEAGYFSVGRSAAAGKEHNLSSFEPSPGEWRAIESVLNDMRLGISAQDLLAFGRRAIVGRELAKFVYSGYVSHTLEAIAMAGERIGLDRESLSYLDLPSALRCTQPQTLPASAVRNTIARNREDWQANSAIRVPYLLFDKTDLLGFDEFRSQPNFVTSREVVGRVVVVDGTSKVTANDCVGAVVLMEAADPGHDWIFAAGIAALVTAFGGENSHMAIRSREFDIPAVIGLGGRQFAELSTASLVWVSCAERRIEVLR